MKDENGYGIVKVTMSKTVLPSLPVINSAIKMAPSMKKKSNKPTQTSFVLLENINKKLN